MTPSSAERELANLAAAPGRGTGLGLVCHVGARSVAAAVVVSSVDSIRILDIESRDIGTAEPNAIMVAASGNSPTTDRLAALATERTRRRWRAELLVARAHTHPSYLSAPVYLPGAHGAAIDTAALLAALRPLADVVVRVVNVLLARLPRSARPELTLSGLDAIGPVLDSVRTATIGRASAVRIADCDAVTAGVTRIADGRIRVVTDYPHEVGVLAYRVRHGLLTEIVESVPVDPEPPTSIECTDDQRIADFLRIRRDRVGPWSTVGAASAGRLGAGRYRFSIDPGRTEWGRLRVVADTGEVVVVPIEPEREIAS
ncbi:hypothetical protein [Nocardia caishijiensis]|uniref:Uncharacterized protein n=1 Tax=Nocardia caishijiensis TaxID=184756 RepID=A0ABQ6YHL9_9NOCA|nr:hypothetical protein [Nocardia caishijiensis]KAF0845290.1 hypothetical protein FNL39_10898 [Nocardia caishijiensis]